MIRKGTYAMYKGSEYKFIERNKGQVELVSKDKKSIANGFKFYDDDIYTKVVSLKDIDDLYRIHPKAKYKGEIFGASPKPNNRVLLACVDAELAAKLGFDRTDKYMYSKYVDLNEVDIIEEKKPYPAKPK